MADTDFIRPKRWSAQRKLEIVLRLFRGEAIDDISREIGVEIFRIEEWKQEALVGMESRFKKSATDPLQIELSRAKHRIGDLSMEVELLKERVNKQSPLAFRRSKL